MTERRYIQLSHRIVRAETAEHFGLKRGEHVEPSERLLEIVQWDIALEREWRETER
jgi:Zn/Cd-binding protein ZinT